MRRGLLLVLLVVGGALAIVLAMLPSTRADPGNRTAGAATAPERDPDAAAGATANAEVAPAADAPSAGAPAAGAGAAEAAAPARTNVAFPRTRVLVRDLASQAPRAGLGVRVRRRSPEPSGLEALRRWFDAPPLAAGVTDAEGIVVFELATGAYPVELLDAWTYPCGAGELSITDGREVSVLDTRIGGCAHGKLQDAHGAPLEDADVFCLFGTFNLFGPAPRPEDCEPSFASAASLRWVRSGADGSFLVRGIPPARSYEFCAWKAGHAPFEGGKLMVGAGEASVLVPVRLEPGLAAALRVVAADGRALAGATVRVRPGSKVAGAEQVVRTDHEGRVQVADLARGVHQVVVTAAGHAPLQLEIEPPVQRVVALAAGLRLRGTVHDRTSGAAVADARIKVFAGGANVEAGSRRDGSFELTDLPGGSLELWVEAEGFRDLRRKVRAGGDPVELKLVRKRPPAGR